MDPARSTFRTLTQLLGPVSSPTFHSFPLDPVHHPDLWTPSLLLQTAACKQIHIYIVPCWSWIIFFKNLLLILNQIVPSMTTDTHFYISVSFIVSSAAGKLCILINKINWMARKYSHGDIWVDLLDSDCKLWHDRGQTVQPESLSMFYLSLKQT